MARLPLPSLTRAGLPGLSEVPWGSHFCQFYRDRSELLVSVAQFFAAGLDNGERCLWLTHEASAADARRQLERDVPGVQDMIKEERIRFRDHRRFMAAGKAGVAAFLDQEERRAVGDGHKGLRVAGNPTFVGTRDWPALMRQEHEIDSTLPGRRVLVLCSYSAAKARPTEIFQIVRNHRFALERQDGHWKLHQP